MNRFFFILLFLGLQFGAMAQRAYTVERVRALHDSVKNSRWDVGGEPSKYSFRYMAEFFPTTIINPSSQPYSFGVSPKKSVEAVSIQTKQGTLSLDQYLKKLHIASFIVVHKGSIVYEKYFSMLKEDQHTLQSVTKVITGTLITNLINEKKIIIDHPIEKYIPDLANTEWQGISVRDILNMRSGMDSKSIDFESGPFSNPEHKNYQLESALGVLPKADNTPASVYEFIKVMKKDKAAGMAAEYSNINTFILGWLAEKVTGQKYADLVSEKIWKPMGASSHAYVCTSETGIPWYHGGMSATLRDLARFGMLFTRSEIQNRKEQLISFNQVKEIFAAKPIESPMGSIKWAYQWDIASNGVMMKSGFGGQALYIHPEKEIVIVYFNYVDQDWSLNTMISEETLNAIIKAVEK